MSQKPARKHSFCEIQKKLKKDAKKVLTGAQGCGIILERKGPPERMTSESGRSKAKRTNMDTLKNEPQVQ